MVSTASRATSSFQPDGPPEQTELWHEPARTDRAQLRAWLARLRLAGASRSATLVALALWSHADWQSGQAWPSVATLVSLTAVSERQVRYCLRWLERAALVTVCARGGGRGRSTRYRLESLAPICARPAERGQAAARPARKGGNPLPPKNPNPPPYGGRVGGVAEKTSAEASLQRSAPRPLTESDLVRPLAPAARVAAYQRSTLGTGAESPADGAAKGAEGRTAPFARRMDGASLEARREELRRQRAALEAAEGRSDEGEKGKTGARDGHGDELRTGVLG